jgi:hypothetical protein
VSAGSSEYRPPTLEDEDEHRTPPVHNLPDDTETPEPEQSQIGHTNTGKTLVQPNVRRYLEGARFVRTQDDKREKLEVYPIGKSTIVTLMGNPYENLNPYENGDLNPYTCFASRPGESNDFHELDQLDQGGQSFGSFKPGNGSVVYLKKGKDVDTEADRVSGYAVDYLEYGQHEPAESCS